ncbi:MAG: AAA family ATPase [Mobilitalea sp.]
MKEYTDSFEKTQYEDLAVKFNCIKSVEARYIHQAEPNDIGNDLIEALIPLRSEQESIDEFEKRPYISPHERKWSPLVRSQAVFRLDDYRIGRDYTHLINQEIDIALKRCYRARTKFNLAKIEMINESNIIVRDCEYRKVEDKKTVGFSIIGISGGGKSTALSASLYRYPQVICHTAENSRCIQIVYIKVECPPDGSLKSFYNSCLTAMEDATGIAIPQANRSGMTVADLERLFKVIALRWNLGVIVIEEIQQISSKRISTLQQFLTLTNDLKIPLVFVGTYKVLKNISDSGLRLARRLGDIIPVQRFEKDILWDDMLEELWNYQWLKEYIPLTQELNEAFYIETAGIIDRVIALFEAVQLAAILLGEETTEYITPDFIRKTSERYFYTTRDTLVKLSTGKIKDIIKIDDIFDKRIDKQALIDLQSELRKKHTTDIITDKVRKTEKYSQDQLCNNIITNICTIMGDKFTLQDIEKVLNYLQKKYKKAFSTIEETKINAETIELLLNPDRMIAKKQRNKTILDDYNPPSLGELLNT